MQKTQKMQKILLKSAKLFEYEREFGFCQDFVSRQKKEGRKI